MKIRQTSAHFQDSPSLWDVLGKLRHFWWLVVLSAMLVGALFFVLSRSMTPIYASQAVLAFDRESFSIPELKAIRVDRSWDPAMARSEQYAVLSARVIDEVVDQLELYDDPDYADPDLSLEDRKKVAIRTVQRTVFVEAHVQSYALTITGKAHTPELAATLTRAIVDAYLRDRVNRNKQALTEAATFIKNRRDKLHEEVVQADLALSQALGNLNQVSTQQGLVVAKQLESLTGEQLELRLQRQSLTPEIMAGRRVLAENPVSAERLVAQFGGEMLMKLLEKRNVALEEVKHLSATYRESHPTLQAANAKLASIEATIKTAAEQQLRALETKADAIDIRLKNIEGQVTDLTALTAEASGEQAKTERLRLALRSKQQDLERYEERLAQTMNAIEFARPDVSIFSEPEVPVDPISPRIKLFTVLGLLAGGLVSSALVLAWDFSRRRLRSVDEIEKILGVPALGALPLFSAGKDSDEALADLVLNDPWHPSVETLRTVLLETAKRASGDDGSSEAHGQVLVVVGAEAGEGKTSVCLALGRLAARSGSRVLLIDGDLRNGRLSELCKRMKLVPVGGELDVFQCPLTHIHLVPADKCERIFQVKESLVMKADAIAHALAKTRAYYDLILIDTPPVLRVADAAVLADAGDSVLMVVRWGDNVREPLLNEALVRLDNSDKIIGFLANCVPRVNLNRRYVFKRYGRNSIETSHMEFEPPKFDPPVKPVGQTTVRKRLEGRGR